MPRTQGGLGNCVGVRLKSDPDSFSYIGPTEDDGMRSVRSPAKRGCISDGEHLVAGVALLEPRIAV